jgi:hypothetical protein
MPSAPGIVRHSLALAVLTAVLAVGSMTLTRSPAGATSKAQLQLFERFLMASDMPAGALGSDFTPTQTRGYCSEPPPVPHGDVTLAEGYMGQQTPLGVTEYLTATGTPKVLFNSVVNRFAGCRSSSFEFDGQVSTETGHSIAHESFGQQSRAFSFVFEGVTSQWEGAIVFRSGDYVCTVLVYDNKVNASALQKYAHKALSRVMHPSS